MDYSDLRGVVGLADYNPGEMWKKYTPTESHCQRQNRGGGKGRLDVEPEINEVAVMHDVLLPFNMEQALITDRMFGSKPQNIC